jgi:hypothetical protein
MKKVFKNHAEVCHVYASRSQETGTAGNVSFKGNIILSYHWWPMANFVNDNTILIVNHSYSSSTSKHLSLLNRAISDQYNRIYVLQPCEKESGYYARGYNLEKIPHEVNIADFLEKIKTYFENFKTSHKYKPNIIQWQRGIINEMIKYCQLFNIAIPDFNEYSLEKDIYYEQAAKQEDHLKELETKREEKRRKLISQFGSEIEALKNDWINGKSNRTDFYDKLTGYIHFDKTYLRVKNDTIETSLGANVPLREAKLLYDMIQRKDSIKGHQIGHYTVIGINGTLKIGCHEIERDEINRIAKLLNW